MQAVLIVVILVLIIFVLGLLFWLINTVFSQKNQITGQNKLLEFLQKQLEALKQTGDGTRDVLQKSLQNNQNTISQSIQSSQKVLGRLNMQIGRLQEGNEQMLQLGSQVRRLQNILSSPQLRGDMGEKSLENMLAQIIPKGSYQLQYSFRDNQKVDALVKMNEYSVPIDAKFPLPAFEKIMQTENEDEKTRLRRQFVTDVICHIDKIASSYIRPAEGTLDFAIMYIPSENIYYETIVKYAAEPKDLLQYAMDKKVIPVSPNLLYTYLMTVVMGLHGLQIEEQAGQIRRNLKKLNSSFADFVSNWDILGKHLHNSYSQYESGRKKLDRFGFQLEQIQQQDDTAVPAEG